MPSWPQVLTAIGAGVGRAARGDPLAGRRRSSSACAARPRSSRRRRRSTRPRSTPPSARCASSTTPSTAASARAPKFPPASAIEFLLGRGEREMALHTLRRMASGGMYDQIGGGFARYSVDRTWLVPHFEKMLYDNALLARAYLHAWQVTGEPLFERVCRETLDWALAELRQEEGAFASALDADSEGVEGKFYVWTLGEVREVLGDELAAEAIEHFGMTEARQLRGREHPRARDARPAAPRRAARAALRGARAARVARPRRQAPDGLERADDLRARRRRRGARRARATATPRCAAPTSSSPACATRTAACCAPTTAARRGCGPCSRTTRSCSRRC